MPVCLLEGLLNVIRMNLYEVFLRGFGLQTRTSCDDGVDRAAKWHVDFLDVGMTAAEESAKARQSPPPQRPKLIIQPAHPTPLDAAALTQLQRDNVELRKQVHEQSDTIMALRRDVAAANARLSDVTGIFYGCNFQQFLIASSLKIFTSHKFSLLGFVHFIISLFYFCNSSKDHLN